MAWRSGTPTAVEFRRKRQLVISESTSSHSFASTSNCYLINSRHHSSSSRTALIDDVVALGGAARLGGEMILTHTFDDPIHGLVVGEYRALMASSRFTLCPEGVHVESYRLWEALEVWI